MGIYCSRSLKDILLNHRRSSHFLIDVACLLLVAFVSATSADAECFNFDISEGDGWDKGCFGPSAPQWEWDSSYGHESNGSMKSGEFRFDTIGLLSSGICREVEGPVDISFWWMSDTNPSDCGKLIFLVDGRPIATILGSNSWQRRTHSIGDNKSHVIEWRFVVTNSRELKLGMGRIDEVCINSRSILVEEEPVEEVAVEEEPVEEVAVEEELVEEVAVEEELVGEVAVEEEPVEEVAVEEEPVEEVAVEEELVEEVAVEEEALLCYEEAIRVEELSDAPYILMGLYNDTVYVEKNVPFDPSNHIYNSISEAISHVLTDGTVKVGPGVYEENVVINKPLKLVSADKYGTIINAQDNIVYISANGAVINNFTINGGDIGIYVNSGDDVSIMNNYITNCDQYGIKIKRASRSNIERNIIRNNPRAGICLFYSNSCYIIDNTIFNSDFGVVLANSNSNMIDANQISEICYGIKLYENCCNNRVGNENEIEAIRSNSCCDLFVSECYSCQNGENNIYYGAYERC